MDDGPADRTRLILTIQRQTETLDRLHAALREEKEKNARLTTSITGLEAENTKLSVLRVENAEFRRELAHLQGLVSDFQRRQEEVYTRETLSLEKQRDVHHSEMRALREQVAALSSDTTMLRTALEEKDARIAVLVDKLSSEGSEVEMKLQIEQMRDKMSELQKELKMRAEQSRALTTQSDHLKVSLEGANEEINQKDSIIHSLDRENKAYKKNLSQLIQQKHGHRAPVNGGAPMHAASVRSAVEPDVVYEPLFDEATMAQVRSEGPLAVSPRGIPEGRAPSPNQRAKALSRLEHYKQRSRRQ
eukprot:TRINITY_DN32730_c0_g1_i1.p1 TRINITY_DN32730_c0_g1~~TRINITY_DN32730_c0_g1_i1.p1  ORF type:complete len:316 (+),score=81.04 TRINITY_DN32730_c0_g1_i1:40-948(+)